MQTMVLVKVSAPDMVAVMVDPDPTGTLSKYAAVIPLGEAFTLDGECGVIVYVLGELALSTIPVTVREGAKFATMHTTMFPGVGAEAIVTDSVVPLPPSGPAIALHFGERRTTAARQTSACPLPDIIPSTPQLVLVVVKLFEQLKMVVCAAQGNADKTKINNQSLFSAMNYTPTEAVCLMQKFPTPYCQITSQ
jgi:hypothetical protein